MAVGDSEELDTLLEIRHSGRGEKLRKRDDTPRGSEFTAMNGAWPILAIMLLTSVFACAQQGGNYSQAPGSDDLPEQVNCSDQFSSCTTGADRSGTGTTYT